MLVLCGEGSERARLEALATARNLGKSVHFLGWRDDVHDLHSAFTLFTMSSRSEGTSVSLLEAMSAGLCPVVTDVGGNAAVLGPGLSHRLVAAQEPAALAAAWTAALTDHAARSTDGAAARARVEQAFALSGMVRSYEELYALPVSLPRSTSQAKRA
ncbi:MAG TPA: glycosyltransferase [Gemmatimonadaceae bacterium]|nr:glycosyltransferase [Gemmatimonadaceae bacterium]